MKRHLLGLSFLLLCASLTACSQHDLQNSPHTKLATAVRSVERGSTSEPSRVIHLTDKKEKLADIRTQTASTQQLQESLQLSSTIESPSDATGTAYSQVAGVVTQVFADVGDNVRAGQVVAVVNSPDLADLQSNYLNALARMDEAKAQVKLERTRLEVAKSNEERLEKLLAEGIAAKRDAENARAAVAATDEQVVAAKTNVTAATTQVNAAAGKLRALGLPIPTREQSQLITELPIRAPVSGIVTQRNVNPGQSVGPQSVMGNSKANSLMTIANLSKVWVMLEVPQSQVSKVRLGASVTFHTDVAPDETFVGTVTKLGENFDPASRCVMVRTEINNRRGFLKPGMVVIATTAGAPSKESVVVPSSSLQNINGQDYVFVAKQNHTYELREVCCGDRTDDNVALANGVNPGESVVTNGSFYLKTESVRSSIGECSE